MKIAFMVLSVLATTAFGQEMVQVICQPTAMIARIQKELVHSANHTIDRVHMNDKSCIFNEEDGDFYVKAISPITSCGTHYTANETHVVFTNSISTVDTGLTYPYGVVIGSQDNSNVLSALISCTYRIDLNVSTMFIPNITIIVIHMPDAFETGEFQAAMALFEDATYQRPFNSPPLMNPQDTLYVGVRLLGEVGSDIYLLVEECWGTVSDNPEGLPKYPLIQDGCPVAESGDGLIRIAENGIQHQAMWNGPVFKFVGEGEEYENVWLHCDLQLCINQPCRPTCPARRKKRSIGDGKIWGPKQFNTPQIISIGPIKKVKVTEIYEDNAKVTYVEADQEVKPNGMKTANASESNSIFTPSIIAVIGVLGGLALICAILALVVVVIRLRSSQSNSGFTLTGATNKAFA